MEKLYEEKWYQRGQNQQFWAKPRGGTGTKTGWYWYHLTEPIWYRYRYPRIKISVLTDISVLGFYGYIGYIGDISMDIFT